MVDLDLDIERERNLRVDDFGEGRYGGAPPKNTGPGLSAVPGLGPHFLRLQRV